MKALLHRIAEIPSLRCVLIAWRRFDEDNSFALSGYLAYTGLLSFFPFMVFIVMSGSFIVGEAASMAVVEQMFGMAPPEVSQTLQPVVEAIIAGKSGLAALASAAVGLWAGSNAFEAARIGFNSAYDVQESRHFFRRRLQSLVLAGAAASVFVMLAFLIVLWPTIAGLMAASGVGSAGFDFFFYARYAIGLPMFALLLVVLHTTLPHGKREGYHLHVLTEHQQNWTISVLPGVLITTVLWFIGATAFSAYLRFAPSFAGNYGTMAGVVITLLFFYMSSVVIFLGAQINIAREEIRRGRAIKKLAPPASAIRPGEDARFMDASE